MKCPLCACENGHKIYKLCDNMKIMGKDFPESPSYVVSCERCGLVYMDTEATQSNFLEYYKHGAVAPRYYDMFGKAATVDYYDHLLKLLASYIEKDSRILDIAGAWGEFGAYLREQGYEKVTVLDPNEACIANAHEQGLKTVLADSTDMSVITNHSIDVIILNHTLEHILAVKETMEEIGRILKEDGCLFIELPDLEGYVEEEAAPFNFLTYEHVLHMTMNDLQNLAALFGYVILESGHYYKRVSNYPSIYMILKKGERHEFHFSDKPKKCMKAYIEKSNAVLERFLRPLRESKEPLVLWGVGASTAILIESFDRCNVISLVDRNPNRQGLVFTINECSYRVSAPEMVDDGTIVILSIPYHDSIERQIRQMELKNKIVALK